MLRITRKANGDVVFKVSGQLNAENVAEVRALIEARLEQIEGNGGDPFTEYSLPEAILKLRQGVGRLIRTQGDSGIVVILDPRILTKSYGKAFLKALPKCPVEIV